MVKHAEGQRSRAISSGWLEHLRLIPAITGLQSSIPRTEENSDRGRDVDHGSALIGQQTGRGIDRVNGYRTRVGARREEQSHAL